jgi:hypothetical protein
MSLIDALSHERTLAYAAPPEELVWPKPTQAAITTYIKEYEAYDAALVKLYEAETALEEAAASDTLELVKAVAAESPDPGTPHADKARRELEYASERLRQKYRAAGRAEDAMITQIKADHGDVISQAVRIERERIAQLEAAHAAASELISKANREFTTFGTTVTGLDNVGIEVTPGVMYGAPLGASGITMPQLEVIELHHATARLNRIDPDIPNLPDKGAIPFDL